jgi:hypothetical protein
MRAGNAMERRFFWGATAVAALTVVLAVTNAVMVRSNRTLQNEVNQRQQFINQSIQLSRVNEALVRALATASVNNNDTAVRDLLVQHGIRFESNPNTAPATR